MIPILQPLPLDWSGVSIDNRTKGEIHDLTAQFGLPYRVVIMEKGYFYGDNLSIMDSRGYVLTTEDYQCIGLNTEIADETAKSAFAVMLITNPDVGNYLRIEAQMVGGRFCSLGSAILEAARNVVLGANRKVYYRNLKDKPSAFRPSGHLHALWELFGFTEQTNQIKRMTTAIDRMTGKEFGGLFDEFLIEFNPIKDSLISIENRLTTHIADQNDPHDVTAEQVQLQNVVNGPVATQAEAAYESGTVMGAYTTPLRSKQVVDTNFTPNLTQHANDKNNPHRDTAELLGTVTTTQFRSMSSQYYDRGETVAKSSGLGGRTFADYFEYVRRDIPAQNILTGILPSNMFSDLVTPPAAHILQPTANGTFTWRSIADIFDKYITKGNQVIYAGNYGSTSYAGAVAFVTSSLGTNFPDGTIAVLRGNGARYGGTGNGGYTTNVSSIYMAVINGGVWRIPAYT